MPQEEGIRRMTRDEVVLAEYREFLAFCEEVGWNPPIGFDEWYEQRDHDEDEESLSEAQYAQCLTLAQTGC